MDGLRSAHVKPRPLTVCLGAPQIQRLAPVPGRGEEEGPEPAADAALSFLPYGEFTKHLHKRPKKQESVECSLVI